MKLRYVTLFMGFDSGYIDPFRDNFNLHSRFISNYMSMQVRKFKFETDGTFNMISVEPSLNIRPCRIVGDKALNVTIYFDKEKYDQLKKVEKFEYSLQLLEEGYRVCSNYKDIPLEALLDLHTQFREEGYKNEWLHKKKRFKDQHIEIILYCYFTSEDFQLKITVNDLNTKDELISGIVIKTLPHEVCFQPLFKDIIINNNVLGITDFLDRVKFTFSLSDIYSKKMKFEVHNDFGLVYIPFGDSSIPSIL